MSFERYLDAQQQNQDQVRRLAHFNALVPLLNNLYERSVGLVPQKSPPHYGRSLLLCHKGFLSAAALISRGQPDDAAGVTRRAIEVASLAIAVKHDPENLRRWSAFEERLARWQARNDKRRPKPLKPDIVYPQNHPTLEWLRAELGMLSDAFVHFTPEFIYGQDWRIERAEHTVRINLRYFTQDQRVIERELVFLAGIHVRILDLLNECFDRALHADAEWARAHTELLRRGQALSQQFAPASERQPNNETQQ